MNKIVLVLSVALLIFACKAKQLVVEIPPPIASKIIEFAKQSICADAVVKEYSYQGKRTNLFENGICIPDKEAPVYDSYGKFLGALGGFAGNDLINGESFSNALFVRELWRPIATTLDR